MKNKMQRLYQFLAAQSAFTAVMGTGADMRLYPFVAPEKALMPFAIYTISSDSASADGRQYSAAIQLFYDQGQFTEMVEMADTCVSLLEGQENDGFDIGPVDTDYSEYYKAIYTTIQIINL